MGLITGYLRELRVDARARTVGAADVAQRLPARNKGTSRRTDPAERAHYRLKSTA